MPQRLPAFRILPILLLPPCCPKFLCFHSSSCRFSYFSDLCEDRILMLSSPTSSSQRPLPLRKASKPRTLFGPPLGPKPHLSYHHHTAACGRAGPVALHHFPCLSLLPVLLLFLATASLPHTFHPGHGQQPPQQQKLDTHTAQHSLRLASRTRRLGCLLRAFGSPIAAI